MVDLFHNPEVDPKAFGWWPLCENLLVLHDEIPDWSDISQTSLVLERDSLAIYEPTFGHPFRVSSEEVTRHASATSLLCRACGVAKSDFTVLDGFGGFGIDALALAHFSRVEVVERDALTFIVLVELASRFQLPVTAVHGDVFDRMSASKPYDVVYLDPMFPRRNKKALPNQAMQFLQLRDLECEQECEQAIDLPNLLERAQEAALDRVVLKRRSKDSVVGSPNHSIVGKSVRFDVYR